MEKRVVIIVRVGRPLLDQYLRLDIINVCSINILEEVHWIKYELAFIITVQGIEK